MVRRAYIAAFISVVLVAAVSAAATTVVMGSIAADQFILDASNQDVTLSRRSGGNGATFARKSNDFTLSIFKDSIVPGATRIGALEFEGLNSAGAAKAYGLWEAIQQDNTAGSEDSGIDTSLYMNGAEHITTTQTPRLQRFYNPDAPPPDNWEAMELSWNGNTVFFYPTKTGSGAYRDLRIGAGPTGPTFRWSGADGSFRTLASGLVIAADGEMDSQRLKAPSGQVYSVCVNDQGRVFSQATACQ
jgi:hypothetical protein